MIFSSSSPVVFAVVFLWKVDYITSNITYDDLHPGLQFDNHPGNILSLPENMTKVEQMSTKVSSKMDCVFACVGTSWCRSVNFKITAEVDHRHICELIATDFYTHSEQLKQDENFTYLSIKNPCEEKPCRNNGNCTIHYNRLDYLCQCRKGLTGDRCQNDVDECTTGSHSCHDNATCHNSPGSFTCKCKIGFVGNGTFCNETDIKRDCSDIFKTGERRNGAYLIDPDNQGPFQVYCDMTTDGGGWTVFQRRQDGSVDFYLGWQQYKTGFGNLNGEFWLGNDYIHRLTARTPSTLRIDMEDWDRLKFFAKYGSFSVGNEIEKYRLNVGSYLGSSKDSLTNHNNMVFTTKDRDNDQISTSNCAVRFTGAWWYNACYHSNLNGKYLGNKIGGKGINWKYPRSGLSLKYTAMKVRPILH